MREKRTFFSLVFCDIHSHGSPHDSCPVLSQALCQPRGSVPGAQLQSLTRTLGDLVSCLGCHQHSHAEAPRSVSSEPSSPVLTWVLPQSAHSQPSTCELVFAAIPAPPLGPHWHLGSRVQSRNTILDASFSHTIHCELVPEDYRDCLLNLGVLCSSSSPVSFLNSCKSFEAGLSVFTLHSLSSCLILTCLCAKLL